MSLIYIYPCLLGVYVQYSQPVATSPAAYSQQPQAVGYSAQPYGGQPYGAQGQAYGVQGQALQGPPQGHWKDGICDCCSNLYPSCWCATCCMHGAWITAQMAQKTNYASFRTILAVYWVIAIICWGVGIILGNTGWFVLPAVFIWVLSWFLRVHVAKYYNITQNGSFVECCTAFWCCTCSLAQMARHMYGYRKVFEGDSDPDMPDYYTTPGVNIQRV
jgi:Cys-rich protein (TIGR01571 family)